MSLPSFCRTVLLLTGLSLSGISSGHTADWPRQITDSRGTHTLEHKPQRIVSTSVTLTGSLLAIDAPVIASGAIDNMVIKTVVDRTRPFLAVPGIHNLITAHGSSFPSGHTGTSFAAAGVLWQTLPRLYGAGALALAALIGLSRLYLGVHYPSDVLGGMLIGLTIAGTIVWLYQRSREKISV